MKFKVKNVFYNLSGFFSSIIVAFFLSPFVVHRLGNDLYGLWTFVVSLTGYYGLFDLGIRSALSHYTTRYLAQNDTQGVNRTVNTALIVFYTVALVVSAVTLVLVAILPKMISIETVNIYQTRLALGISGLSVAMSLPLAVFTVITFSLSRFDIQSKITIFDRLLSAALTVLVLSLGFGLVGLATVTAGCLLLSLLIHVIFAFHLYPKLTISVSRFCGDALKEMWGYGVKTFFLTLAERIMNYADAIIIGLFMTSSAITYYSIASNLIPYFIGIVASVSWTFLPATTASGAKGDMAKLRDIFLNGSRGIVALSTTITTGLILMGKDFIGLWMGQEYVSGVDYASSGHVLSILACAAFLRLYASPGKQVLMALRQFKVLVIVAIIELAANILLSVMLVRQMGLIGVALGSLIPLLFTQLIVVPKYILHELKINWKIYFQQALIGIIPISLTMVFTHFLMANIVAVNWGLFGIKVLALSISAGSMTWFFVLQKNEKQQIWRFLKS